LDSSKPKASLHLMYHKKKAVCFAKKNFLSLSQDLFLAIGKLVIFGVVIFFVTGVSDYFHGEKEFVWALLFCFFCLLSLSLLSSAYIWRRIRFSFGCSLFHRTGII
jgi:hypothetical protein